MFMIGVFVERNLKRVREKWGISLNDFLIVFVLEWEFDEFCFV